MSVILLTAIYSLTLRDYTSRNNLCYYGYSYLMSSRWTAPTKGSIVAGGSTVISGEGSDGSDDAGDGVETGGDNWAAMLAMSDDSLIN